MLGPEGAVQSRIWSLSAALAADMARDRVDLAMADELEDLLGPAAHHHDVILAQGVIALARDRAGDHDLSRGFEVAFEILLQDHHDELHRRVVIVEQDNLVHRRRDHLGGLAFDDDSPVALLGPGSASGWGRWR